MNPRRSPFQGSTSSSASEARFRTMLRTAMDGVWLMDESGRVLEANETACKMLGYTREEMVGLSIREIDATESAEETRTRIGKIIREGSGRFEVVHRRKDGSLLQVEVSTTFLPDLHQFVAYVREITERKLAETQAKQWRQTFFASGLPLAQVDHASGRLLQVNQAFAKARGYQPADMVGQSLEQVVAPALDHHLGVIHQELEQLGHVIHQTSHLRKDGSTFPVLVDVTLVRDKDGVPRSRIVYALDLTDLKKAEEAQQKSMTLLRTLIDAIPDQIWLKDIDGVYLECNPSFERICGAPARGVVGKTDYDLLNRDLADSFRERDRQVMATGNLIKFEEDHAFSDGGRRELFETIKTPIRGTDGKLFGVLGIGRDITERKTQELELLRMNRLYNLLSQLGQSLIRAQTPRDLLEEFCTIAVELGGFPLVWVSWLDSAILQALPIAKAGESMGYLDGATFWADIRPEGLGPAGISIREDRSVVCQDIAGAPYMAPWHVKAEAFGLRALAAFPIHHQGQVAGSFMVYAREPYAFLDQEVALLEKAASDISFGLDRFTIETEKARLQAQLQQAQKMESLGNLAGGIAHDMNNVLGAILGLASANLELQPAGSPTYRAFETITKAATRGGKMVKGLLSFARQTPVEISELSVNELLFEVVRLLEHTTLAKVRIEVDVAGDLRLIRGDASALSNAFMNLCVNAVDAMAENGTLTLRSRNLDDGWVEIRVEDTGTGMPKEVLARAMDPFYTTKEQGKGTGLGLTIVYSTVKAHQGQLDIESEPGRGTCIVMRFPATAPVDPAIESIEEQPFHATQTTLEILVVDDDELIRNSMEGLLKVLGHTVILAARGEEALAALEAGLQPDVVILDMNMPGLGGSGTLPRLRVLRPALPVLIATGRADQAVLDLIAADSRTSLLNKPFALPELRACLNPYGFPAKPT